MKNIFFIVFLFLMMAGGQRIEASVIYVDAGKSAGLNNGTSWANAFLSFQSALDVSVSGDQIWVAKGIYHPSYAYDLTNSARYYHFRMKNGVAIYGGFAGTETAVNQRTDFSAGGVNETILSGDLNGDDAVTGAGATLSFSNNGENCYHVLYHPGGLGLTATAILDGFSVTGGNANGTSPHSSGGGILNYAASISLNNISVYNNSAASVGGGISNNASSLTITNFSIRSNSSLYAGMYSIDSSPVLINGLISDNKGENGGGLCGNGSPHSLTNVTITNNYATYRGGAMYCYYSNMNLKNCIVWGNMAADAGNQVYTFTSTTISFDYSCYANGVNDIVHNGGSSNSSNSINADPLFANVVYQDYRISGASPCADAGNDSYNSALYDIRGTGYDRKLDKATGGVGVIDIGAYEYKAASDPLIPCNNPGNGGVIAEDQSICKGTTPAQITSTSLPTGYSGTLEYKWQSSITSNSSGFSDIIGADNFNYQPAALSNTTWYKRLVRVNCMGDWTGAAESNVVTIAVNPVYAFTDNHEIFDGESYAWQGTTYSANGTYTASYLSSSGCDSVYTLHLTKKFSKGKLCDWLYFNEISIDNTLNPDALTDYTVLVLLNTADLINQGKVNADGSDFRFTTDFTNDLEYWIEPGIQNEHGMNDDNTHVWVKIPLIPALSNTTLYMFYGNPSAAAKSNISSTFLFGDDFNDNTIDTTRWDATVDNLGQIIERNKRIEHNSPRSSPQSNSYLLSTQSFTGSIVVDIQFKKGGYVYRGTGLRQDWDQPANNAWFGWQDWGAFGPSVTVNTVAQSYSFRSDYWSRNYNPEYYLTIYRKPDSTFRFVGQVPAFEPDGAKYWDYTFTTVKMPIDQPLKVAAYEGVWVSASTLWDRYEDNIRVRKYSEPEPFCTMSAEQVVIPPDSIIYDTICNGDTLLWREKYFTTAGTYYDSLLTQKSCDSVFILHLSVNPLPIITVNADTICKGGTAVLAANGGNVYLWNTGSTLNPYSVSLAATTTFTVTGTDTNLCSNTAQTIVTVIDLITDIGELVLSRSVEKTADANTIVLDHFNNSSTGVLHGTLGYVQGICGLSNAAEFKNNNWLRYGYNANLRDAATIDFWIYPKAYSTPLVDINWNNTATTYPGAGHVFHLDINAGGNIVMSNWPGTGLGMLKSNSVIPLNRWTHITVCWGDSTIIYFNGEIDIASPLSFRPSASGNYSIYVPKWGTANELYLDELHISKIRRNIQEITSGNSYLSVLADEDTICENSSVNIMIVNPQTNIKYQLYKDGAAHGNPQTGICDTLSFNTGVLTSTSQFTIEAMDTTTGCSIILDTTFAMTVIELPTVVSASVSPASVCVSGQVEFSATASTGTITWYDAATGGSVVMVTDPAITSTTTYYSEAITSQGCVSIGRTAVTATVNSAYEFTESDTICSGDSYTWQGNTYSTTGTYTAAYTTTMSCDSTYTLNLIVNPAYSFIENQEICYGNSYTWRGDTYSTAGTYTESFAATKGCDSTYTLNLMIKDSTGSSISQAACNSYTAPDGQVYTASGIITAIIPNYEGCDSTITINLTINTVDTSVVQNGITLTASLSDAIYQWLNCDDNFAVIEGETNQHFSASVTGVYAVEITQNNCIDTSACYSIIAVGIAEQMSGRIKVYPNPVSSDLVIEMAGDEEMQNVEILNAFGQVVYKGNFIRKATVHASHFTPGIYLIKIDNGETFGFKKIIKE